jgi:predicted phage terminase large subunit-like protein
MKKLNDARLLANFLSLRQRARTDLLFLATDILGYKDVEEAVHRPLAHMLQKFQGGEDKVENGVIVSYTPATPLWELDGNRSVLILYPRGHLKTTVITMSGSIQWMLNYPDIRILLSTATGDQVKKLITEITAHFRYNPTFRWLFPDYCPPARKVNDWGTQEGFTLPNRLRRWMKEPTLSTCTVGKVIAGGHYEVIINSDLVDKENVKTSGQVQDVKDHFHYLNPLLERGPVPPYHGWQVIEGTPYAFGDLYMTKIQAEEDGHKEWSILVKGATLDPDKKTTLWPTRFPWSELMNIKKEVGDYQFACQMECRPINPKGGLATPDQIKFIPRSVIKDLLPSFRLHVTIDLHGMEAKDTNDYTVITLAGFDRNGRMYVLDIKRGHYTPFEVIELIFALHKLYPNIADFKVEKDAHARVLMPFLRREMSRRQQFPIIVAIPRSNQTSKKNRIWGLQPWFQSGIIRFAEDIECRLDLIREITSFSNTSREHDDILDTLCDQMQNREGGVMGDVVPMPSVDQAIPRSRPEDRFLGYDPITRQERWLRDEWTPSLYYSEIGI